MLERWRQWARSVKRLIAALIIAYRDPRTPLRARIVAACVLAYAFSPIDLVPDIIPILGYLDDLLLLPLGILLVVRLLPDNVWREAQLTASTTPPGRQPVNWWAVGAIVVLWIVLVALVARWGWQLFGK